MTKARDLSNLISTGVPNSLITLDANEIPNIDAGKITTGQFADARIADLNASKLTGSIADARIPASAVSQHATSFDDNKIVNDISTLAIRQASNENKGAYNTNSMYVDVFQDATGITGLTNATRDASEYVSTTSGVAGDTTINLGSEIGSGWSGANNGVVNGTATDLVNDSWSDNVAWTSRAGDTTVGNTTGDVGEFGTWCTLYKGSTFSVGAVKFWNGHPNGNDPLGIKDMAIYTSTDTTNGSNGNWTIVTPLAFAPTTDTSSNMKNRGQRTSAISSNHFILSNMYNDNNNLSGYADIVAFAQLTGIKGVRFDIRTGWNNGYYSSGEKPHIQELQIFDDGGVTADSLVTNATGSFESNAITASSSTSSMGGIITYQDNAGTNALNTDIVLKLSADGGSNYSTATLVAMPDFSSGIKMAKVNDLSVTAGTQLKYKISFANQSSGSKEARIRGVSLQY